MPVYQVEVTFPDGTKHRDEIEAKSKRQARILIEDMGFTLNDIHIRPFKTLNVCIWYWIDRLVHPRKYDPATAYDYMLKKVRREHPELDE